MFRVAIFDMDGLLIDSEPLWRRVERKVFAELGLQLSTKDCEQTTGLRVDEVVRHWYARQPWSAPDHAAEARRIVDGVVQLVRNEGEAKPGVWQAVNTTSQMGMRLALASSSPPELIDAVLKKLGLSHSFELTVSALGERMGKPHPAVYLRASARMNVSPQDCIAFEDSLNGVIAAKAARMVCVAVPDVSFTRESQRAPFAVADAVLDSLEDVSETLIESLC